MPGTILSVVETSAHVPYNHLGSEVSVLIFEKWKYNPWEFKKTLQNHTADKVGADVWN